MTKTEISALIAEAETLEADASFGAGNDDPRWCVVDHSDDEERDIAFVIRSGKGTYSYEIGAMHHREDADFCARARTLIPELVEQLKSALDDAAEWELECVEHKANADRFAAALQQAHPSRDGDGKAVDREQLWALVSQAFRSGYKNGACAGFDAADNGRVISGDQIEAAVTRYADARKADAAPSALKATAPQEGEFPS